MSKHSPAATLARTASLPRGVSILGPVEAHQARILDSQALDFLADLQRRFGPRRTELLAARAQRQARLDRGERPELLPETESIRAGDWTVAPQPDDLLDRRVEITGPVDRKLIINALNSGASVFMADFEDSTAPTWATLLDGQVNLADAVAGTIDFTHPGTAKHYELGETLATLMVRPRGWHLPEKHLLVDGEPISASLFDFGLYLFHNARTLVESGSGPYFYLPKLQSHLEARLWNDVFIAAQEALGLPSGTIKATVLIEHVLAAFEMDEILYELREHSAGLNCGRWDYIFSFIKTFREDPAFVLPDRREVGMTQHFLRSYSQLLIRTCHRRRVHAMGGMAAQIPIKDDEQRNRIALASVQADKQREVDDGHDGTWVAHPGLVPVAKRIFDQGMPGQNQIDSLRSDVHVSAADLLTVPQGSITEAGLRQNVNVGVLYLAAWLGGTGCVPLYDLMEDAATAEISRTQLWQWIRHSATLDDGRRVDVALFRAIAKQELQSMREQVGEDAYLAGHYVAASALFDKLITAPELADFLTLPAYDQILTMTG